MKQADRFVRGDLRPVAGRVKIVPAALHRGPLRIVGLTLVPPLLGGVEFRVEVPVDVQVAP